jgi:site-specific DNA-methyltransferase (adenine-specific)
VIKDFDPARHSLHHAAERCRSYLPSDDLVIRTLREEYGFSTIPEDMLLEDFQALVDDDKDGVSLIYSDFRDYAADLDTQAAEHYEQEQYASESETFEPGPPYRVIYADPGWQYDSKKAGGSMKSGSVQHYHVSTVGEIAALPIRTLRHPEAAVLFLWTTVPMQPEAWQVFNAWGFEYKTSIYWIKDELNEATGEISPGRLGMGWWFRGQVEVCFVGIKGDVRAFRCQKKNYVFEKSTTHSKKPEAVRRLILEATEALGGPRIELFSRDLTAGWDHWGDEVYTDLRLHGDVWVKL